METNKKKSKNIIHVFFSMKTAIVILLLLIVACILGSVITQGQIDAYYTGYYPEKVGQLILLLDLNDVFHSVWFIVLTIVLCLNLLGCNLIHFPQLIRRMKQDFIPEKRVGNWDGTPIATYDEDPDKLFRDLHFGKIQQGTIEVEGETRQYRYGARNRIGIWGAWLTHLGMLIIIVGFALGQIYTVKYTVYGVVGSTLPVEDTGYEVTIDKFDVLLREDETVEQYVSQLTMTDTATGKSVSGEASVNHPLNAFGMKLYQNSTGWAADVAVYYQDHLVQQQVLCAGEHMNVEGLQDVVLAYNAFYPDFVMSDGQPGTASSELKNPGYLYTLYYQNGVLGMNVLTGDQKIQINDYSIEFSNPRSFTLIQVKRDPYTWIAFIGGVLILLSLVLAFYLRTEELWTVEQEDGTWAVAGYSRKGGILFRERVAEAAGKKEAK